MPTLKNVKWERFCQAIVNGVAKQGEKFSQGRAYISAGYNAKDVGQPGGSAEVCASKLLNRAKIENRIAELLHEAQTKLIQKRRYDIETISERMALASQIAEEDRNPSALYGAEKAIAEVRGLVVKNTNSNGNIDYSTSQSMTDIGAKLLQSVGFTAPDDASIKLAIEANDVFVARLEEITRQGQGLMIEQDEVRRRWHHTCRREIVAWLRA
jgi:aldehyde:ferredoxin oxidoreductase